MLVGANQTDQATLQIRIRDALNRFISGCNWVFSVLERSTYHVAGYERINLQAAARVPSSQNYNLLRRAQLASCEGLSISDPQVNYDLLHQRSIPSWLACVCRFCSRYRMTEKYDCASLRE